MYDVNDVMTYLVLNDVDLADLGELQDAYGNSISKDFVLDNPERALVIQPSRQLLDKAQEAYSSFQELVVFATSLIESLKSDEGDCDYDSSYAGFKRLVMKTDHLFRQLPSNEYLDELSRAKAAGEPVDIDFGLSNGIDDDRLKEVIKAIFAAISLEDDDSEQSEDGDDTKTDPSAKTDA